MSDPDALLGRAHAALDDARFLLDDGRVLAAVNRAYYACFYAAQAALLGAGERPRSHKGVGARFAHHFVRTGRMAPEMGAVLPFAADARRRADYVPSACSTAALPPTSWPTPAGSSRPSKPSSKPDAGRAAGRGGTSVGGIFEPSSLPRLSP